MVWGILGWELAGLEQMQRWDEQAQLDWILVCLRDNATLIENLRVEGEGLIKHDHRGSAGVYLPRFPRR